MHRIMPATGTTEQSVARGIRASAAICWWLVLFAALLPVIQLTAPRSDALGWGTRLVAAHYVAVLVALTLRRRGTTALVVTAVPLVLGIALMMPHRSQVHPINLWAPGYWALPWTALLISAVPRRTYIPLVTAMFGALTVCDVAVQQFFGPPMTRADLEPVPGLFSPAAMLLLFCDGLLGLAIRGDQEESRRLQAERQRADEVAQAMGRREAARLLHDHILHALHALARAGEAVTPTMARDECRQAVTALHQNSPAETTVSLAALLRLDPSFARTGAELTGDVEPLPPAVGHTIASAAHELFNNVVEHAPGARCAVHLSQDGPQWRLVVSDDGPGFDPPQVVRDRRGLSSSVVERMEEIGGRARVETTPGRGTSIELSWPARDGHVPPLGTAASGAARRALARTAWPNLALAPFFTALLHPLNPHPLPMVLATGALLTVGAWGIHHVRSHQLEPGTSALLLATSFGAWATNLWCAPSDVHLVHHLWLAWPCAALAHVVVMQVRLRTGILALVGWALGMATLLVARLGPGLDWANLHPVLTVGIGEAVVTLVGYHTGIRLIGILGHQQTRARRLQRASAMVQGHSAVESFWSERVRREAVPLIEHVADGELDPADAAVRRQARRMETSLRDELLLGRNQADLVNELQAARALGWRLTSLLTDDCTPAALDAARLLVTQLGAPATPGQAVTLSASLMGATAVVLEPDEQQVAHWRERADAGAFQLQAVPELARLVAVISPA